MKAGLLTKVKPLTPTMVRVVVKWGKVVHEVELDASAPVSAFKDKLYELTGVSLSAL